jgi:hypothetical protein
MASGVAIALFALTYTLLVVETLQYVTFSISRAHMASHQNPERQKESGQKKYRDIFQKDTAIARIFRSSWFEIGSERELFFRQGASASESDQPQDFSSDLGGNGSNSHQRFQGVSLRFLPRILNFRSPLLGTANPEDEASFFQTHLNALLIRESSQSECRTFFRQRGQPDAWTGLLESSSILVKEESMSLSEDNGC